MSVFYQKPYKFTDCLKTIKQYTWKDWLDQNQDFKENITVIVEKLNILLLMKNQYDWSGKNGYTSAERSPMERYIGMSDTVLEINENYSQEYYQIMGEIQELLDCLYLKRDFEAGIELFDQYDFLEKYCRCRSVDNDYKFQKGIMEDDIDISKDIYYIGFLLFEDFLEVSVEEVCHYLYELAQLQMEALA